MPLRIVHAGLTVTAQPTPAPTQCCNRITMVTPANLPFRGGGMVITFIGQNFARSYDNDFSPSAYIDGHQCATTTWSGVSSVAAHQPPAQRAAPVVCVRVRMCGPCFTGALRVHGKH